MRALSYTFFIVISCVISISANIFSEDIQQSHLIANLPNTFEEFENILARDLTKYFSNKFKTNVIVEYKLLRNGPTQSGVSYPKFYAWVVIKSSGKMISSGAVRVAVIDKVRVEVTDYISQSEIEKNPISIETVFPQVLCNDIRIRAGVR